MIGIKTKIAVLSLLVILLLTFDVRIRIYEDGSLRATACIPWMICDRPYVEPMAEPLPPADYGEILLPKDHS